MNNGNSFETKRLTLDKFSEKYLTQSYVDWLNNQAVVRFSELRHRKHSLEECHAYLKSFENTPHLYWAILVKEKQVHIGNITAHIDRYNSVADIGILIGNTTAWGQGYGLEAWQAVCEYLFKVVKIRKITAGTLSSNISMLKIMQKAGMKEDGRRHMHYIAENQIVDVCHYCLFNDVYEMDNI